MNLDGFQDIAKDIEQLREIVARLQRYMNIKVEISALESNDNNRLVGSNFVDSPQRSNLDSGYTRPSTISEGIRQAISKKSPATSTEIYDYLEKSGFEVTRKTKNTVRSILSMMKKKNQIEGNAEVGFSMCKK